MRDKIAEAAALYRTQLAQEQGRAVVAMIVHKAGGEIRLSPEDLHTFDSKSELIVRRDEASGELVLRLRSHQRVSDPP